MTIKAFSYGIDEFQLETLKCILNLLKDSGQKHEIVDLRSFDPNIERKDIVLIFGTKAKRIIGNISPIFRLDLPELYRLNAKSGDEEDRKEVYEKIKKLKTTICPDNKEKQNKRINTEDIQ